MSRVVVRHGAAGVFAAGILATLVVVPLAVAIRNLVSAEAVVQSSAWLLLNAAALGCLVVADGPRRLGFMLLGWFTATHFVDSTTTRNGDPELCYGYRILGRDVTAVRIAADRIESVHWGAGQTSQRTGCDCNDWSVAIWYRIDSDRKRNAGAAPGTPPPSTLDLLLVGHEGARAAAERLGREIAGLLRDIGVPLVEEERNGVNGFRRPASLGGR